MDHPPTTLQDFLQACFPTFPQINITGSNTTAPWQTNEPASAPILPLYTFQDRSLVDCVMAGFHQQLQTEYTQFMNDTSNVLDQPLTPSQAFQVVEVGGKFFIVSSLGHESVYQALFINQLYPISFAVRALKDSVTGENVPAALSADQAPLTHGATGDLNVTLTCNKVVERLVAEVKTASVLLNHQQGLETPQHIEGSQREQGARAMLIKLAIQMRDHDTVWGIIFGGVVAMLAHLVYRGDTGSGDDDDESGAIMILSPMFKLANQPLPEVLGVPNPDSLPVVPWISLITALLYPDVKVVIPDDVLTAAEDIVPVLRTQTAEVCARKEREQHKAKEGNTPYTRQTLSDTASETLNLVFACDPSHPRHVINILPTQTPSPAAGWDPRLSLILMEKIATGRTGVIWLGDLGERKVVAKMFEREDEALAMHEVSIYQVLSDSAVSPTFHGVFAPPDKAWSFLLVDYGGDSLENVGQSWKAVQERLGETKWMSLLETLRQLHHLGIRHNDLEPRNVLVGDDSKFRVIDFEESKLHNCHGFQNCSELARVHCESHPVVGVSAACRRLHNSRS